MLQNKKHWSPFGEKLSNALQNCFSTFFLRMVYMQGFIFSSVKFFLSLPYKTDRNREASICSSLSLFLIQIWGSIYWRNWKEEQGKLLNEQLTRKKCRLGPERRFLSSWGKICFSKRDLEALYLFLAYYVPKKIV